MYDNQVIDLREEGCQILLSFQLGPQQQTSLAPRWANVDPVGSTLGQRGPNVSCYLEWFYKIHTGIYLIYIYISSM